MQNELIIVSEYCDKCHIEPSFIEMLQEIGLIDIRTEGGERCLQFAQLPDVERYSRMYYDLSINIEGNANVLSDKFNSKKAGNADWQFNALIGLNIKFGKGYTETKPVYYEAEPVVVEQPKPAPVVEQP